MNRISDISKRKQVCISVCRINLSIEKSYNFVIFAGWVNFMAKIHKYSN